MPKLRHAAPKYRLHKASGQVHVIGRFPVFARKRVEHSLARRLDRFTLIVALTL